MKDIDFLLIKLKKLTNSKNDKELCLKLNINYSTLDTWKNKDKIPDKRLIEFAAKLNVNIEEVLDNKQFGNINNMQHSKFAGNATGVDNSNKKNIGLDKKDELECDEFTKSLIKQLCVVYKDEQTKLQNEIMKLIQNG